MEVGVESATVNDEGEYKYVITNRKDRLTGWIPAHRSLMTNKAGA